MSKELKGNIEKEVENNSNPDKAEEKKKAIRRYQEDMARYMNGITMVKIIKLNAISYNKLFVILKINRHN